MRKIVLTLLVSVCLMTPDNLLAWGTTGHRVIAELAQVNIKSKTRKKINKLLENRPMAYWANWPDFIKSDKTGIWDHTHNWHFVNTPDSLGKDEFVEYIKSIPQANVYSEIPKLESIILDKKSTDEQKRIALLFLIHLIGDAHQPMHVSRADDLGGNRINVQWFYDKTNIHTVWDSKLVDNEKYNYTEYATILDIMPKQTKENLKTGTLEDWLYESRLLADEIYSGVKPDDRIGYEYIYKYKDPMELQLQKAGLRLASVLDRLFK